MRTTSKYLTALSAAAVAVGAILTAPAAWSAPTGLHTCVVTVPGGLCALPGHIEMSTSAHDVSLRPQGQLPHLHTN
jgi:hypothetical protein